MANDEKNMSPADIKYSIWDTRTDEKKTQIAEKAARTFDRSNQKSKK